jgi:hypothetical protein
MTAAAVVAAVGFTVILYTMACTQPLPQRVVMVRPLAHKVFLLVLCLPQALHQEGVTSGAIQSILDECDRDNDRWG